MIMPGDGIEVRLEVSVDRMRGQVLQLLTERDADLQRMAETWFEEARENGALKRLLQEAVARACEQKLRAACAEFAGRLVLNVVADGDDD